MRVIHKYELTGSQILMPQFAELLHVGEQDGIAYVWALVDPAQPMVLRRVSVVGTGHRILGMNNDSEDYITDAYVGTVQMQSGLVWHVFDGGDAEVTR
jgi:hypothetical protein